LRYNNNGSIGFASNVNDQTRYWRLQKPSEVRVRASIENAQIKVVDKQTAAVKPMTEQLRNQHIEIVINAYYNDASGKFNFVVLPWTEKNEEVEFN
jgi:hypothetical protein